MIIFREKWLWALCLAILVHVGFFFIFYLNITKEDQAQAADKPVNTAKTLVTTDVKNDYTPSIAKTYTETTNQNTNLDKVRQDDVKETKRTTNAEPLNTSNEEKTMASQNVESGNNSISKELTPTLKNRIQDNQNLNPRSDENPLTMASNSDETLENIKNRAGLLAIDTPRQSSNIQLDKAYLAAKSEVDDINNQLSAAINEVKKRNQQKIDERQQLRNGANTTENQNSTGIYEQEIKNDGL
jgi:hypothetical protein